jgi:hypothetical protein
MRPSKTEKARSALRDRPSDLTALERRVLILSDGARDADALAALLGTSVHTAMPRLLRDGYLVDGDATAAPVTPSTQPHAPATATTPAPASRRSLAAAKVYMFDMLQLQRGEEATAIATALRACRDHEELALHLFHALRHIRMVASASYSRRVAERLSEILPEQYKIELDAFGVTMPASESARV